MRDVQSVSPLIRALGDSDGHVVKNAFHALKKFGNEIVPKLLPYYSHSNSDIRLKVHELLLEFGSSIIPILRKELDAHQWVVGNRIVHLIWEIGKTKEEDTLIACLGHRHAQKNVILLLGALKSLPALPHLIRMYQKPNLRRVIFYAIRLIGKEASFPIIIHSLNNSALAESAETLILKIGVPALPFLVKELANGVVSKEKLIALISKIGPDSVSQELLQLADQNKEVALAIKDLRKKIITIKQSNLGTKKSFGLF